MHKNCTYIHYTLQPGAPSCLPRACTQRAPRNNDHRELAIGTIEFWQPGAMPRARTQRSSCNNDHWELATGTIYFWQLNVYCFCPKLE